MRTDARLHHNLQTYCLFQGGRPVAAASLRAPSEGRMLLMDRPGLLGLEDARVRIACVVPFVTQTL